MSKMMQTGAEMSVDENAVPLTSLVNMFRRVAVRRPATAELANLGDMLSASQRLFLRSCRRAGPANWFLAQETMTKTNVYFMGCLFVPWFTLSERFGHRGTY